MYLCIGGVGVLYGEVTLGGFCVSCLYRGVGVLYGEVGAPGDRCLYLGTLVSVYLCVSGCGGLYGEVTLGALVSVSGVSLFVSGSYMVR